MTKINFSYMSKKVNTLGGIIKKVSIELDNEKLEQLADTQMMLDELAEFQAAKTKNAIFENLPEEYKTDPEAKIWYEKINWIQFDTNQELIMEKEKEISSYLDVMKWSRTEKANHMQKLEEETIIQLASSEIGRELISKNSPVLYLQLFIEKEDIILEKEDGSSYSPWLGKGKDFKEKVLIDVAYFKAIKNKKEDFQSVKSSVPDLKEVTKSETHYNALISILKEENVLIEIENNRYEFKPTSDFKLTSLAYIMNNIHGYLKRDLKIAERIAIAEKTFNAKYSKSTAYNELEIPTRTRERYDIKLKSKLEEINRSAKRK